MIGLVLSGLLAMAPAGPSLASKGDRRPLAEALSACAPRTLDEALDCMQRHAPAPMTRAMLAGSYRRAPYDAAWPLNEAVQAAWFADPRSRLATNLRKRGLAEPELAQFGSYLMKAYWLREHGCLYDERTFAKAWKAIFKAAEPPEDVDGGLWDPVISPPGPYEFCSKSFGGV